MKIWLENNLIGMDENLSGIDENSVGIDDNKARKEASLSGFVRIELTDKNLALIDDN